MKSKVLIQKILDCVRECRLPWRIQNKIDKYSYYFLKIYNLFRVFQFKDQRYHYFCHRYNMTWINERSVEIPIAKDLIKNYSEDKILEVGNVLSHYFKVSHDIVDKFEKAEKVINQDIVSFTTKKRYDLIIVISTLEHIGWDEPERNPEKIPLAVSNMKNLLTEKGIIFFTIPLGENPFMDRLIASNSLGFTETRFLRRISGLTNKWVEVGRKDVEGAKYNYPFYNANGLVIAKISSGLSNIK
jgi:hypothetical protein